MDLSLFDYTLPKSLIAQEPSKKRSDARLLVYNRKNETINHAQFKDIDDFLPENVQFFRNQVSVLKARLFGQRKTGGSVECLLLNPAEDSNTWWCLIKPGKKTFSAKYFFDENHYEAEVLETNTHGEYKVRFRLFHEKNVYNLANALGKMPLPPYIQREKVDIRDNLDAERYQTVYANSNKPFAAAAPTAGLHFTNELIQDLKAKGHDFFDLSLNVGIGTFQPIQVDAIENHKIHTESFEIHPDTVKALYPKGTKLRVAVGTTSVRAIESFYHQLLKNPENKPHITNKPYFADTDLYLYPPAKFHGIDAMITNFHLPRSSLLCLVSAFLSPDQKNGVDLLKKLYNLAIKNKYKFYSYGDAMLIL
ncbi:MAG: tRNA preQ1(34) S-adenosylmethionine ribosyltransferase-isomerase QueA [Opitutae bacterium]|jgi:S-adenosylmethionine:tRNA ribosyltransferase-isomerase|nr:tRNA preQ1(34) S-adenosylmethionine ribosyltransferase-isomerase QueA [Opitutae bacterium]